MPALHRFFRRARPISGAVLDLLYPPLCTVCGHRVADASVPLCPLCTTALPRADADEVRQRIARQPTGHVVHAAFALWHFEQQTMVQRVQHALKYGNRPRLGDTLGRWIGSALPETLLDTDIVVPVPLSRVRLYERGYNQSARLARGIGEVQGWPVREEAVTRTRITRSQTRLSETARWTNVSGAFAANPDVLSGQRVLLVDDVLTTGATLCACAATLRDAGASVVNVTVLGLAGR